MITFTGVTKRYPDGTVAVDDLTLEVPAGTLTVFVGPSGCGKTTSMRMINRMIDPTRRQIRHRRQRPHFVGNIVINRMLSRTNQIVQTHGKNRPETRFVDLLKRVSHHPQQRLAFKIRFNREAMSMHRPRIGFIKYARFITDEPMGKLNIVIEYRLKGFAEWSNKSINPRTLH